MPSVPCFGGCHEGLDEHQLSPPKHAAFAAQHALAVGAGATKAPPVIRQSMAPDLSRESAPHESKREAIARWLVLIVLSLYLVFAHGCHGDEDNELFAAMKAHVTGGALP